MTIRCRLLVSFLDDDDDEEDGRKTTSRCNKLPPKLYFYSILAACHLNVDFHSSVPIVV
jgi:hypothetical protein